ncbi:hypothetical protein [Bordetella petrii]|uniref:hypothetical protein n=1 Tax=Bordetella petrii TaxID=94624 RepID=UPI0005A4B655|nr:hypothetical protein [Bordetella petrii]
MSEDSQLDEEIRQILDRGQYRAGGRLVQSNIIIGNRGVVIIGGDGSVQQAPSLDQRDDAATKCHASG